MYRFISIVSGFLFGVGMILSGMSEPANVIAFLDIHGAWSPNLAFVMGGALLVFTPTYFLVSRKSKQPVCTDKFCLSDNKKIDGQLITGAILFGIGWGIAGICPGPAVASIANGSADIVYFVVAMLAGMQLGSFALSRKSTRQNAVKGL